MRVYTSGGLKYKITCIKYQIDNQHYVKDVLESLSTRQKIYSNYIQDKSNNSCGQGEVSTDVEIQVDGKAFQIRFIGLIRCMGVFADV